MQASYLTTVTAALLSALAAAAEPSNETIQMSYYDWYYGTYCRGGTYYSYSYRQKMCSSTGGFDWYWFLFFIICIPVYICAKRM